MIRAGGGSTEYKLSIVRSCIIPLFRSSKGKYEIKVLVIVAVIVRSPDGER